MIGWLFPLDIGIALGLVFGWAVLALALALRLLNFPDLTVEGSLPLGAAVFAYLVRSGVSLPIAITGGVAAGAAAGMVTGFLHVRLHLNKFLAGIVVVAVCYTLCLRVMGGSNIGLLLVPSVFDLGDRIDRNLAGFHPARIGMLGGVLAGGATLLMVALSTRRGLRLRAAASNPEYAKSLGINVSLNVVVGLAITNALSAAGGVLLAMYQGFADVSMGQGVLILALAAITIGERLLPEGRLNYPAFVILAALFGSVVYQIVVAFAVRLGLAATDLKLVTAVMVVVVVAVRASRDGDLLLEQVR